PALRTFPPGAPPLSPSLPLRAPASPALSASAAPDLTPRWACSCRSNAASLSLPRPVQPVVAGSGERLDVQGGFAGGPHLGERGWFAGHQGDLAGGLGEGEGEAARHGGGCLAGGGGQRGGAGGVNPVPQRRGGRG